MSDTRTMQTIGLIGGMSWESTTHYYELLNRMINQRLGGYHAAKLLLYSIDFAELEELQRAGKWTEATALIVDAGQRLARGGADMLLICANTMHISAPELERAVPLPLLQIADAAAERILQQKLHRVGLLGTAFTMERDFYTGRLRQKYNLDVLVPGAEDRRIVHDVIFQELVRGIVNPASKAQYREIIGRLVEAGAEGIILGCTELMMIVEQSDSPVPLFDTTTIHCEAAVEQALGGVSAEAAKCTR